MLRGLVLLFVLLNAALFFWIQGDPPALRSDREPQRLQRQVSPDAIQVLPDLPTASAPAGAPAADGGNPPASAAAGASSAPANGASASANALAHKTGDTDVACLESGPLTDTQVAYLRATLAKAGVQPEAIAERRQQQAGTWMIYMGRYADAQAWQQKADELRHLNVRFERVTKPASLNPGLSLGSFSSPADAGAHLADLGKHGVRSARVIEEAASSVVQRLQVRAVDTGWRKATGDERFGACPVDGASTL